MTASGQAIEPAASIGRRRARGPLEGLRRGFHRWWFAYAMLAPVFVVMGVLMAGIGIVGEYVGRIYQQVRGRPRFLIRKVWGD